MISYIYTHMCICLYKYLHLSFFQSLDQGGLLSPASKTDLWKKELIYVTLEGGAFTGNCKAKDKQNHTLRNDFIW